jgi:hypothetical protein
MKNHHYSICLGLLCHDWLIKYWDSDKSAINLANYAMLLLFNIPLVLAGLYLLCFGSQLPMDKLYKLGKNLLLIFFSVLVCLAALEGLLRTGILDDPENPFPVWIPYKYKKINEAINRHNIDTARQHPFKFNDKLRPQHKDNGAIRIAILGDSFIWGDGVPYDIIWSHKLEERLRQEYNGKIEVLSWGCRGWSTRDQFRFLEQEGIKNNLDLLIVAFTANDPDMGHYQQKYFKLNMVPAIKPLRALLPNAVDFFSEYLEAFLNKTSTEIGYRNWEDKLYTPTNLQSYTYLLRQFSDYCSSRHLKFVFVLTPCYHDPGHSRRFRQVIPLLEEAHIPYYDLTAAVAKDLQNRKFRELWANPANPHPGALLTDVYAREVYQYLKTTYLPSQADVIQGSQPRQPGMSLIVDKSFSLAGG